MIRGNVVPELRRVDEIEPGSCWRKKTGEAVYCRIRVEACEWSGRHLDAAYVWSVNIESGSLQRTEPHVMVVPVDVVYGMGHGRP